MVSSEHISLDASLPSASGAVSVSVKNTEPSECSQVKRARNDGSVVWKVREVRARKYA